MGFESLPQELYRHILTKSSSKVHSYKEHNCVRVFSLVSGRKAQAKAAARAHTTPWKMKRKWRPDNTVKFFTVEVAGQQSWSMLVWILYHFLRSFTETFRLKVH